MASRARQSGDDVDAKIANLKNRLAVTTGTAREPLLQALCDEEFRAERSAAEDACAQLVKEFPNSPFADEARRRIVISGELRREKENTAPAP
jgi:hypothetical protein